MGVQLAIRDAARWATGAARGRRSTTWASWPTLGQQGAGARATTSRRSPSAREVGDRGGEGTTLNNLGGWRTAWASQRQARALLRAGAGHRARGGRPQRRRDDAQQPGRAGRWPGPDGAGAALLRAGARHRAARSATAPAEGTTLNNLGVLADEPGAARSRRASYYEQALAIAARGRRPRRRGDDASTTWAAWPTTWASTEQARSYYEQALAIRARWATAPARGRRSTTWAAGRQPGPARRRRARYYEQALAIAARSATAQARGRRSTTWAAGRAWGVRRRRATTTSRRWPSSRRLAR